MTRRIFRILAALDAAIRKYLNGPVLPELLPPIIRLAPDPGVRGAERQYEHDRMVRRLGERGGVGGARTESRHAPNRDSPVRGLWDQY